MGVVNWTPAMRLNSPRSKLLFFGVVASLLLSIGADAILLGGVTVHDAWADDRTLTRAPPAPSDGSSLDFDVQYERLQCGGPRVARFKDTPDGMLADPVVIRATIVRMISKEEVSALQAVTNHSEATTWAIVSVDEVIKGQITDPTLLAHVGCFHAERVGKTGFLSGRVVERPTNSEMSEFPPELAYALPKAWTGMPIRDHGPLLKTPKSANP